MRKCKQEELEQIDTITYLGTIISNKNIKGKEFNNTVTKAISIYKFVLVLLKRK